MQDGSSSLLYLYALFSLLPLEVIFFLGTFNIVLTFLTPVGRVTALLCLALWKPGRLGNRTGHRFTSVNGRITDPRPKHRAGRRV